MDVEGSSSHKKIVLLLGIKLNCAIITNMKIDYVQNKKGTIFILISALMFGSYGVWSRLIGDDFGVFYQSWTRSLLLSIILVPILIYRKEFIPVKKKDWGWLSIYLLFTSMTQAPIFYAFNHMDIGSATLFFFVTMLLTMYLVGFIFLGEKVTKIKIISFLLALVGMYSVFSFSLISFTILAAMMAILNGVASGGEVSFSKKLSNSYSPLYLTTLSWLIIIVTNGPISFILGGTQYLPSFNVVWLYWLGYAISGLFAFYLIIAGLKYIESSIGGLMGLLEIVFSISFGIIIFKENLTYEIALGALLIIFAAALPHIHELRVRNKDLHHSG